PKLSGYENILNAAAVLGLSAKETKAIIEEVVDFAELDDFMDSPVQTYSSGMYARLGFSVAVHLNPNILLVDEILAVGDYAFQNKCFGKMQQLKNEGVAIVLVSHAHSRVVQLCDKAVWLHKGQITKTGSSQQVVKAYLAFMDEQEARKVQQLNKERALRNNNERKEDISIRPTMYGALILDSFEFIENLKVSFLVNGKEVDTIKIHDELVITYRFDLKVTVLDFHVSLIFYRKEDGLPITTISTLNGNLLKHINSGRVSCQVTIPDLNFHPGRYVLVMPIHEGNTRLYRNIVKEFVVTRGENMTWGLLDLNYSYDILT
ncbi:MAG: hypothetical protein R3213_04820, partial [Flavobacteriaceae bacterium]|nr:hypothetical protein [Flavobacteriaceae bacterium]